MNYITEPKTGAQMLLHSGEMFDLMNPDPDKIHFGDIAWALSRLARFNGHTRSAAIYTVAQHSVLVAELVKQNTNDAGEIAHAILHDAHEAYIGDITYPVKMALCEDSIDFLGCDPDTLPRLKARVQAAIVKHFRLPPLSEAQEAAIRLADSAALVMEKRAFMGVASGTQWFEDERFALSYGTDSLAVSSALALAWESWPARWHFRQVALQCMPQVAG